MGCCSNFSLSAPSRELVYMLQAKPNLDKFKEGESLNNYNTAMASKIFGGSVFLPIGSNSGTETKRTKLNNF